MAGGGKCGPDRHYSQLCVSAWNGCHISKMRYKGPGLFGASWNTQRTPSCARPVLMPIDATIWQTQAVQAWCRTMGLTLIHFDECELSQSAVKSTVLATDLEHERALGMNSSDLSRYLSQMMQGISKAMIQHAAMDGSQPALEVRAHSLQPTGGTGP